MVFGKDELQVELNVIVSIGRRYEVSLELSVKLGRKAYLPEGIPYINALMPIQPIKQVLVSWPMITPCKSADYWATTKIVL